MISEQGENLVFLLGIPRSGTTLLSVMLNNHPTLRCPPEPWVMLALESMGRTSAHDPSDAPILFGAFNQFRESINADDLSRQFALGAYNQCLADSKKKILIDKTPRYYLILPYLRKLFPRAKYVVLWRNPLDVAASMKEAWGFDVPALLKAEADHPACIDLVVGLGRLRAFSELMDTDSVYQLKYEELVRQPGKEMERLFGWLGLENRGEAGRFELKGTEFGESRYGDQKVLLTDRPHAQSIGKWRDAFTAEEAAVIVEKIGSQLLNAIGYRDLAEGVPATGAPEQTYHRLEACISKRQSEYTGLETYADLCLEEQRVMRGLESPPLPAAGNLLSLLRAVPDMTIIKQQAEQSRHGLEAAIGELQSQIRHKEQAASELHSHLAATQGDRDGLKEQLEKVKQSVDDEQQHRYRLSAELDRAGMYAAELTHAARVNNAEIASLKHELKGSRDANAELQASLQMAHQAATDRGREATELANRLHDSMDSRAKESSAFADRLRESADEHLRLGSEMRAQRVASARVYLKWRRTRGAMRRAQSALELKLAELNSELATLRRTLGDTAAQLDELRQRLGAADISSQQERHRHCETIAAKNKAIEALAAATRELDTRLRMLLTSRFMRFGWKFGFGSVPYWDDPARDELTGLADALMKQLSVETAAPVAVSEMDRALQHLVSKGFQPKVVLDIGAAKGYWSRSAAARWPAAQFFMIDPLTESERALAELCRDPRFHYTLTAVGKQSGNVVMNVTPDCDGSSCLEFPNADPKRQRCVQVRTVNELLNDGTLRPPDFVKIDVQGFELEVLEGGIQLFESAEVFILEASLFPFMAKCPLVDEVIQYMADRGFVVFDLAGLLRRPFQNDLGQMDLVFVSKSSALVESNRWA